MSKKRSPEQLRIAGTERPDRIAKLDNLAEEARDIDDQIEGLKEAKDEIGEQLVGEMQDRGLKKYVYEGRDGQLYVVDLEELLKVKAKIKRYRRPQSESAGEPEASN